MSKFKYIISISILLTSLSSFAQEGSSDPFSAQADDLQIGGDIFSDFNEDLESAQVMEDERYYRYGRFYSATVGLGTTTFDGNRGSAYENRPPTWAIGLNYFNDFRSSFGLGVEFSKHQMFIGVPTKDFPEPIGLIDVSLLRTYFSYRYYIDTTDLGTALTYSNPYFIGRFEYWYQTNKFIDQSAKEDEQNGAVGIGVGGGLEFPIKLRESYLGVEFLWHQVNLDDKYTDAYGDDPDSALVEGGAYEDLSGNVWTFIVNYVFNW